jgi:branched-chain amino acid transport system ATP-binding protein
MDNTQLLLVEEVTKRFRGLIAVKNLSFEVNKGEIVGLIGPNGAGKTTLLNLVSGVLRPDEGKILFEGIDITSLKPHEICKKGIGRTLQIPLAFPELTTLENVILPLLFIQNLEKDKAIKEAESILQFIGFPKSKYNEQAANLNTLELKYLQLAKALAGKPRLLLLDEVTTGLNPVESMRASEIIKKIQAMGITILLVEHVMRLVVNVCDRVIVLSEGSKIAEGKPEEAMKNRDVISLYLGKSI